MSHYDAIIEDVKRLNDSKTMNFEEWMMWGITKITLLTALILDNIENMDKQSESEG